MAGGASHLLRTPLSVLQEEWEAAGFVRVHRSYLVALDRIVELRSGEGGHRIRVTGQAHPADLPVSRRHLRELNAAAAVHKKIDDAGQRLECRNSSWLQRIPLQVEHLQKEYQL